MAPPLISCICVTREELALPYHCFRTQTYPNLELVLVHENEAWEEPVPTDALLLSEDEEDDEENATDEAEWPAQAVFLDRRVRSIYVPKEPKQPLSALYNAGVAAAKGAYVVIWDPDDWSAPDRVERQLEAITGGNKASALLRWYIYDWNKKQAYCSSRRTWEGSLMAETNALKYFPYPDVPGFNSRVIDQMISSRWINSIDMPEFMIHSIHRNNYAAHGQMIIQGSQRLKEGAARDFEARFQEASKELLAQ
jgi:glycosyltransferase involved in cell wall biosynthesis